jgi:Arc/MetJ-type ribon-helix-helix transcriptional regulator
MATPKDSAIKVRLPQRLKEALKTIADERFTSESEIAREAILEYLRSRNIEVHEQPPPPYRASSPSEDRQKDIGARAMGIVKKHKPRPGDGSGSSKPRKGP